MKYHLRHILLVLSISLLLATIAWHVRSYFYIDLIAFPTGSLGNNIIVMDGRAAWLGEFDPSGIRQPAKGIWSHRHQSDHEDEYGDSGGMIAYGYSGMEDSHREQIVETVDHGWPWTGSHSFLGISYSWFEAPEYGPSTRSGLFVDGPIIGTITAWRLLSLPVCYLYPIFLLLPLRALAKHQRRRHRRRKDQCESCGYNLKGTTQRCPECGHPHHLKIPAT